MKSYKLSQRQKNIIHLIGDCNEEYITVSDIANKLDVSARTVQRDLGAIEVFLEDNDFSLIKKPGHGLILDENKESISYLYELLEMVDSSKQLEKVERVNFILSRLLTSKQAIKYYAFTVYLNISEKTLTEDLNLIEKWLLVYDIKLLRKRGEGISIVGSEKSIRKAQAKLINDLLNDDKKIEILRNIYDDTKIELIKQNDILSIIDGEIINKTKKSLDNTFKKLNISITDDAYVSLLVHVSLAIERLRQDRKIDFNQDVVDDFTGSKEFSFAKQIIAGLEEDFSTKIPDIEIYFVAMHIKGIKIVEDSIKDIENSEIINATNITNELINEMESIYGLHLDRDKRLEKDLKAHLIPALNRLKFHLAIKNPILDEIVEKYGSIFSNVKRISPNIIKKHGKLEKDTFIPDDEIGYIAIHFISAIEAKIMEYISVNTITVCPTGYGTSRLLKTNLENHFSNINIVDNASIMKINRKYLEEKKVDLIISTIKIDNLMKNNFTEDIFYINMPAIPDEDDYMILTNMLREISRIKYYKTENKSSLKEKTIITEVDNKSKAKTIFEISRKLDDLYKDVKFFQLSKEDDLFEQAARRVACDDMEAKIIEDAILERNKINSTYFEEFNLHLLHAKCDVGKAKLAFGKVYDNQNIIVMISPIEEKEEVMKFFADISASIVEDSYFMSSIDEFDENKIRNNLMGIIYNVIGENL